MLRHIAIATCLTAVIASFAAAGEKNDKLDVGEKAPAFEGLAGIDGKSHSLGDYKEAKAIVVCFTCNTCPIAAGYEARFIDFTKEYKDKGVAFVAVNVNDTEADTLEQMRQRAAKKGLNFDYLKDASQESARAFGAKVTPHMFVLDEDRKVAYMGKFDDSFNPNKVTKQYVRDAVDALLAGKPVETSKTRPLGCGIRYELK